MKYEFTGTVKNDVKPKFNFFNSIFIVLILIILISIFSTSNIDHVTILMYIVLILLFAMRWFNVSMKIPLESDEIDENDPYFRGVIVKVRLYDDYIQITKLGKISWDNVNYVKERAYLYSRGYVSRAIEIIFENETGRKRIYLIENTMSPNSSCRYVNTMVDNKTYKEVLNFLKENTRFLGMLGF